MGSVDPSPVSRFVATAQAAGCDVAWMQAEDIANLPLVEGAVVSRRALERYPVLSGRATRPMPSPLVSFPQGVISGELGIAETGSVLVVEDELPDRLVSMMSEHLVVLLGADEIAEGLEAATEWLSRAEPMPLYVVLVTGGLPL